MLTGAVFSLRRQRPESGREECVKSIAMLGNIANNFYREARLLAEDKEMAVTLFVGSAQNVPNTETPSSDPGYQSGGLERLIIRTMTRPLFGIRPHHYFLPRALWRLDPKVDLEGLRDLEAADLIVLSGPEIVLGTSIRAPFVIRPTGSDLTVRPSLSFKEFEKLREHQASDALSRILARLKWSLERALFRRAYKKATAVAVTTAAKPYERAISSMKLDKRRLAPGIPLAIDLNSFKRTSKWSELLPGSVHSDDFLVFFPSRMMIKSSPTHIMTGQWKASEVGIIGFKHFLDSLPSSSQQSCWLLIPDRVLSDDLQQVKELLPELGIEENVVWLAGSEEQGLTRKEMIPLYSSASATLDDFGAGWYGSVVVEAMACESPVVTFVSEARMASAGNPPILVAQTAEGVSAHLLKLHRNRELVRTLGRQSRKWVSSQHGEQVVRGAYLNLFEAVDQISN